MKISNQNITTDILRQNILEKANESFSGNKKIEDFSKKINDAINSVAESQNKASQITKNYELGKEQDLTKVIVLVLVIIFTVLVYGLFDLIGAKKSILKGYV